MIIPMTNMFTSCLTYEQLRSYSLNNSGKEEHARLYKHISTCELCSCAVNGFTAISFSSFDVDAIQHQIDMKANAAHVNLLTFARVLLIAVSVISIIGFYHFANSFSGAESSVKTNAEIKKKIVLSVPIVGENNPSSVPKRSTANIILKHERRLNNKKVENTVFQIETLKKICPDLIPPSVKGEDDFLPPNYNADIIYIYDLKITQYNSLYFNHKPVPIEIKGYTPSYKENKGSANYLSENDDVKILPADKILKSALAHFNKGKFSTCLGEFQSLLEKDPDDVNSLFYCAISYYQIGKYERAIKELEAVLKNTNNVFHPESKWNLAQAYLKLGNNSKAQLLLVEIVNEKGFYSKRASEKLKSL